MHTWLEINKEHMISNLSLFKRLCSQALAMPVIKSNAYGHGLTQTLEILEGQSLSWIGVNCMAEAAKLRQLNCSTSILVMGPIWTSNELDLAHQYSIDIMLGSQELWELWLQTPKKPQVHIKIDTGMSRHGFTPARFSKFLDTIPENLFPYIQGLATHFADVEDSMDTTWAQLQLKKLLTAAQQMQEKGHTPLIHSAATAAALVLPASRLDVCRIGIGLYGLWPGSQMPDSPLRAELKPVLSWRARLTSIKEVSENSYVGYGCSYKTRRKTRIAVLPVGYYEGYPRLAGSGDVLIQGKRCSILGRICMNMMMVDVTDLPTHVTPGDIATLIGRDGSETISANEVAQNANTIHYEIVTRLNPELPRIITTHDSVAEDALL